ncbi:MAG: ATPase [Prevotellaceae bacterium]|jgi:Cdc6-like AAA superfamily ATPase|nr:ATPase [Prevotellaceae bacterium]
MVTPFIYGRLAKSDNFTNRIKERQLLTNNFNGLINTIIISPRRWGKTSLVRAVSEELTNNKEGLLICHIDIFNCKTEEQFLKNYANAILRTTHSAWDDFVSGAKKYLGRFVPSISLSDAAQTYELSFGVDFKDSKLSIDEILDLPQKIAENKNEKVVVCIDEFQNIDNYSDSLAFQQILRSHWQLHDKVCYCLYGSKRHLLMNIFNNSDMPFYKFGDILFLQKISREDWIVFIKKHFENTEKSISEELSGQIADRMQNHPYYTQQYSQQVWLRTEKICTEEILQEALESMMFQMSLLFANVLDELSARQTAFLKAIVAGETNFSSKETLKKYDLGTSANIKNLKKSLLEKDIIDILPQKQIVLQDPVFELWLNREVFI